MAQVVVQLTQWYQWALFSLRKIDFLAPVLLRLYLAPVLIIAGYSKLQLGAADVGFWGQLAPDPSIVSWFGNEEWGLGLPFPGLLAFLAAWIEFLGGWLLVVGLATRLISIPLMFTMLVAATAVHWDNGWFAVAPSDPATSPAQVLSWVGIPGAEESLENSREVSQRLDAMRSILREEGKPDWLFARGNIVVLNNGIEFAATYFIMCLVLVFTGGGRFLSMDYWLRRRLFQYPRPRPGPVTVDPAPAE